MCNILPLTANKFGELYNEQRNFSQVGVDVAELFKWSNDKFWEVLSHKDKKRFSEVENDMRILRDQDPDKLYKAIGQHIFLDFERLRYDGITEEFMNRAAASTEFDHREFFEIYLVPILSRYHALAKYYKVDQSIIDRLEQARELFTMPSDKPLERSV